MGGFFTSPRVARTHYGNCHQVAELCQILVIITMNLTTLTWKWLYCCYNAVAVVKFSSQTYPRIIMLEIIELNILELDVSFPIKSDL